MTPSSRRVMDLLGPTSMGELSAIFRELVRTLKDLPPGGFEKAYALRPPSAAAPEPQRFLCDKQQFKDAIRLAELGASLAEQTHTSSDLPQDPVVTTVLEGLKSLEAKVDQLALDTANLAAKQPAPTKTFADAAAKGIPTEPHRGKPKPGPKGKKPPSAPAPLKAPQLTLSQLSADKSDFVEMTTEAGLLASRAHKAIHTALREQGEATGATVPPVKLRGITCNSFTGDINLHLDHRTSLTAILALKSDAWVSDINPGLGLKRKVYPIIVHGIPTTFKPSSRAHIHDFIEENNGVLDTATKVVWANKYSIEQGKPFSSLIIYLTDPIAANQAITNRLCFKHLLKVTEKSVKRIKQCYTCLDFGHYAKTCPDENRTCSHCAGAHPYHACTKLSAPVRCANCTHHVLDTEFPENSQANVNDLSEAQKASCAHSPFSNQCALRRAQTAKNAHMSDLYDIPLHD